MSRLKDVAQIAGVTPSLVSRFISKDPKLSIRQETRERIQKAIDETSYVAPVKTTRKRRSRLIGVIWPDITHPVFASILKGINDAAEDKNYGIVIGDTDETTERSTHLVTLLISKKIDGLLYASAHLSDGIEDLLDSIDFPCVLLNRSYPGSNRAFVGTDDYLASKLAINYLSSIGHSKIAHICGPQNLYTYTNRMRGYRQALIDNNLEFFPNLLCEAPYTYEGGIIGAKAILNNVHRPTAIYAANDLMAIGVMNEILRQNLRVPEDISVIGVNNIWAGNHTSPSLTSIGFDYTELGSVAFNLLFDLVYNIAAINKQVILAPQIYVRRSTYNIQAVDLTSSQSRDFERGPITKARNQLKKEDNEKKKKIRN